MGLFISRSACILGIMRLSWTGGVFQGFPAKFEFASPLLYYAVRRGILSKRGLHVLIDLLGCFTDIADDRTIADLAFSSIFNVWKGSFVYLPVSGKNILGFNFRYIIIRSPL